MASQPPQQQQQPARFVLSRAGPADAGAIAAADYQCFDEYVREVFMGVKCEADVPLLADWYARMMRDDPHDVWIKVVDAQSGRLAAASNWKVYPSRMPDDAGDKTPDHLVDEVARARSKLAVDGVNRARRKAMGDVGGFIRKWLGHFFFFPSFFGFPQPVATLRRPRHPTKKRAPQHPAPYCTLYQK